MTDWLRYIASYPDLIAAYGAEAAKGELHYRHFGQAEGRTLTGFDPYLYGATHADLARAFGADTVRLARHYIEFGHAEQRALQGFDTLRYAASNPDLVAAFGGDEGRLAQHYLEFGIAERRGTTAFDPLAYAAVNGDLIAAFGTDTARLTRHYIEFGLREGRATTGFDKVGYLLANADLAGFGGQGALRHWIEFGYSEGRPMTPFGADQVSHVAAVGRVAAARFDAAGDRDWFAVDLVGRQTVALAVLRPDVPGGVLPGAHVQAFDAGGRLVGQAAMVQDGFQHWLTLTAATAGPIYVTVTGPGTGSYQLAVARVGPDSVPGAVVDPGGFFNGGAVTDVYLSGNGYSRIDGGAGDDILGGGGGQDDFIGGPGADFMDGGPRTASGAAPDGVSYQFSPQGVTVHLDGQRGEGGHAEGDRLMNIGTVTGSRYADVINGDAGANLLYGEAGDDVLRGFDGQDILFGGEGDDRLYGGDGNDYLYGGPGADLLDGGPGFDIADYQTSDVGVMVDLRSGRTGGGAAGDTLVGIEGLTGSYGGNDILATAATATHHQLLGYGGDDILIDRTTGTHGAFLSGNQGNDLLIGARTRGDEGNDILVAHRTGIVNQADGGSGADTYVVETGQHGGGVFDFSLAIQSFDGSDRIDLSQLRDEGGRILDMDDILAHLNGNIIDLAGFRTVAGAGVFGYIELNQQAGMFEPITPYDTGALRTENFMFSVGVDWTAMIPADLPIF